MLLLYDAPSHLVGARSLVFHDGFQLPILEREKNMSVVPICHPFLLSCSNNENKMDELITLWRLHGIENLEYTSRPRPILII